MLMKHLFFEKRHDIGFSTILKSFNWILKWKVYVNLGKKNKFLITFLAPQIFVKFKQEFQGQLIKSTLNYAKIYSPGPILGAA